MRRVIAALRRQDWTAVVIEVLVVVVGVFLGVQASNWNQDRETDAKAADFSGRLRADLREEAWGYELQIGYFGEVVANARRAAEALAGKSPLPDEDLLIAAYRATQFNGNVRRRATYDELTSTGEISLIRDPKLRDLAIRVYTTDLFDHIVSDNRHSPFRDAFRKVIPLDVQDTLGRTCGDKLVPVLDYASIKQALDYPCKTGLPAESIASAAAILRGDPEFAALLRLRVMNIQTDISFLTVYYKANMWDPLRALAGAPAAGAK